MEVSPAMPGRRLVHGMIHTAFRGQKFLRVHSVSYSVPSSFLITNFILSSLNYQPRRQTKWSVFQMRKLKFSKARLNNPMSGVGERTLITPYLGNFSKFLTVSHSAHALLFISREKSGRGGSFCGTKAPANPGNKWQLVWGTELRARSSSRLSEMRVGKPFLSWGLRGSAFMPFFLCPSAWLHWAWKQEKGMCRMLLCLSLMDWENSREWCGSLWVKRVSCAGGKKSSDVGYICM